MLQKDRLIEANKILSQVWSEMELGYIDEDCLQDAVYCQIDINRIVWKLNSVRNGNDETEEVNAVIRFMSDLCKSCNTCIECPMNHNCNEQPAHWVPIGGGNENE